MTNKERDDARKEVLNIFFEIYEDERNVKSHIFRSMF